MTNRYKQMAMKYLVGKLETMPPGNMVKFTEYDVNNNKLKHHLDGLYFPYGYYVKGVVQGKTSSNDGIEYSVVYGNYQNEQQTETLGFIMILDNEYNLIQIIKQYTNEEYFGEIISLNVGNDGRFYMVELDNQGYYRFVLLNNILVKGATQEDYQVVQRQTYRFPDQSLVNTSEMLITKHPQEAKYLMVQVINNFTTLECTELTINVGSTNDWVPYTYSIGNNTEFDLNDLLASWDADGKLTFKVLANVYNSPNVTCHEFNKADNSDTITRTIHTIKTGISSYDDIVYMQSIIKNFNNSYFSLAFANNGDLTYGLYWINSNNVQEIDNVTNVFSSSLGGIRLTKSGDDIFCVYENILLYLGVVIDDDIYLSNMDNFNITSNFIFINIQKTFNLYTMYIQSGNYVNIGKLIYIDKTNNAFYQDLTSMNPYYGTLYDSDDKLIFARTLYNKNVSGQTTTSIIQVPNQFINNITIGSENLYGHTYLPLIQSTEEFVKNQYEEVYVNFVNTWYMQNQNDPDNVILNTTGATRFNQSISQTNDMSTMKATKYRINYSDDTSLVYSFDDSQIENIDVVPPYTYRYTWIVYNPTDKNIVSIDIISADEQTIFQTIDSLTIAPGTLYTITQDVYVV